MKFESGSEVILVQAWFGGPFWVFWEPEAFWGNLGISSQFGEPLWRGFGSIQQGLRSILGDVYPGGLSTHSGEFL